MTYVYKIKKDFFFKFKKSFKLFSNFVFKGFFKNRFYSNFSFNLKFNLYNNFFDKVKFKNLKLKKLLLLSKADSLKKRNFLFFKNNKNLPKLFDPYFSFRLNLAKNLYFLIC
jgi:hypothetical protein